MKKNDDKILFAAIGDILITINDGKNPRGLETIDKDLNKLIKSRDIVLGNLETTIDLETKTDKEPIVTASKDQILSLKNSGINIVSLSNNHSFDSYEKGYLKLKNILDKIDIKYFGAGLNSIEAYKPVFMKKNNIITAFFGAVDFSTGNSFYAHEKSFGTAILDLDKLLPIIKETKKISDHVIVSLHWGYERFKFPSKDQVSQAEKLIDSGASIIIGHHPHLLQGTKIYKNSVISYSLGNFISGKVCWRNGDSLKWRKGEKTGAVFLCEFTKDKILNPRVLPVYDDLEKVSCNNFEYGKNLILKANKSIAFGENRIRWELEKIRVYLLLPILNKLNKTELKKIFKYGLLKTLFKLIIKLKKRKLIK